MIEKLKKWNSWWIEKKIPDNRLGIIRKDILKELERLLEPKEIIVLSGVRRSGKSTLLNQMMDSLIKKGVDPKNILYFNFDEVSDHDNILESIYNHYLELNNPAGRKYLFFDEIQNIINWEKWIKKTYDLLGKDIKFIITGSNNSMLNTNLAKLLTGRTLTRSIFPLSFKEFLYFNGFEFKDYDIQKNKIKYFLNLYLEKGGFPEIVLEQDDYINEMRSKEYFDSIVLRDIVQPNDIREVSRLVDLSKYSITNIGTIFSYNKISKALGINITSTKEYLSLLENAYLIFQLNFFSYSLKESLAIQKPRKIYAIDNGLRNSLSERFSKDTGKLVENICFLELMRNNKELYFWQGRKEVDFIIKNKDNTLTAINVTYSNTINEREIKGLEEFKQTFKKCKELILITKDLEKTENNIHYIPLWKWLNSSPKQ